MIIRIKQSITDKIHNLISLINNEPYLHMYKIQTNWYLLISNNYDSKLSTLKQLKMLDIRFDTFTISYTNRGVPQLVKLFDNNSPDLNDADDLNL